MMYLAFQVANTKYQRHFMDGDGCMFSLSFPGGGRMPHFRNRYIRTAGFVAEQAAGKPLFRNAFTRGAADGSPFFNPLDLNFKNVANTGVLYWAQQMWALWEVSCSGVEPPGTYRYPANQDKP
jgi:all-trans-8'-apo-beta-carotenal 15,15'-oxygenase